MGRWGTLEIDNDTFYDSFMNANLTTKIQHYCTTISKWYMISSLLNRSYVCEQSNTTVHALTIVHAFTECILTRNFLCTALNHIDLNEQFIYHVNLETLIFGTRDQGWNTISLAIKSYMVYKRCTEQKQYLSNFHNYLNSYLASE